MERQAWKLIVLLLLFCYVHSPYVKAQVGNGKQITMEFKNEGLPTMPAFHLRGILSKTECQMPGDRLHCGIPSAKFHTGLSL